MLKKMNKETMYCLYDPEGNKEIDFLFSREKTVRDFIYHAKNKTYPQAYREGYRIKKVSVTIKPIE